MFFSCTVDAGEEALIENTDGQPAHKIQGITEQANSEDIYKGLGCIVLWLD